MPFADCRAVSLNNCVSMEDLQHWKDVRTTGIECIVAKAYHRKSSVTYFHAYSVELFVERQ
jgi:hypothetical protein